MPKITLKNTFAHFGKICKHKCVSYKTLSKPVSNLKQYQGAFTDLILDKKLQNIQEEDNQINDDEE